MSRMELAARVLSFAGLKDYKELSNKLNVKATNMSEWKRLEAKTIDLPTRMLSMTLDKAEWLKKKNSSLEFQLEDSQRENEKLRQRVMELEQF